MRMNTGMMELKWTNPRHWGYSRRQHGLAAVCLSMYRLGVTYEFGELGVEVDEPKALRFYTNAAALGCTYTKGVVGMWLHRFH